VSRSHQRADSEAAIIGIPVIRAAAVNDIEAAGSWRDEPQGTQPLTYRSIKFMLRCDRSGGVWGPAVRNIDATLSAVRQAANRAITGGVASSVFGVGFRHAMGSVFVSKSP